MSPINLGPETYRKRSERSSAEKGRERTITFGEGPLSGEKKERVVVSDGKNGGEKNQREAVTKFLPKRSGGRIATSRKTHS